MHNLKQKIFPSIRKQEQTIKQRLFEEFSK